MGNRVVYGMDVSSLAMTTRFILQIDGGGILGATPALVLAQLELSLQKETGNPHLLLRNIFDMCCGTSTGAIISGLITAGVPAREIYFFYRKDGMRLFNKSKNYFFTRLIKPKFKRKDFLAVLYRILENHSVAKNKRITLGDLPKKLTLMTTAYNLCSHRTHFIKSTDYADRNIRLSDAIAWSALSAAYFFGKISAPDYEWTLKNNDTPPATQRKKGAVFQDGGQGTQNCTLDFVLTEILAQNWGNDDEKIVIISLGTGNKTKTAEYQDITHISDIGQTIRFVLNQARDESTTMQEMAGWYVQQKRPNIQVFRLDYEADKNYALDDTRHFSEYQKGGLKIIASPVYKKLKDMLVAHSIKNPM
jgi:patatin-like phospholipase/acyl hydrolase